VDEKAINRLLLHYERLYRAANTECINPQIEELNIDDLKPLITIVAKSRAAYLKYVYELSKKYEESEDLPTADELKKLKVLRMRFTELSEGAQAFETSIQRGYLDLNINS